MEPRAPVAIRERTNGDGKSSFQLVVYAGRDGQGRDQYVRRTLTGVSRREASKAHGQLVVDVQQGRTAPSRSLTVSELAAQWWVAGALSRAAAGDGLAPDDLVEEALGRYFGTRGTAVMEELETRGSRLTDDEAMELAVAEIRANRLERPTPSASPGE